MELVPHQQAAELINRSNNVLVSLPEKPSSDAIASGLALFVVLERLGKRIKMVCSNFELPESHNFLPKSGSIERELKNLRQFIITLDVSRVAVEELSYEISGSKLNVFITPKNGFYDSRDVTTNAGNFAFDAVITIGAPDLESLGDLARENVEFFYAVPIINLDHQSSNTRFGQVNLVDVTAASNAEVVFELIRTLGVNVLDDEVATSLLTGIISKTRGFQTATVTPRSLAVASHLIAAGAKREEIVERLFQSKSIAALKLWGRTLARLQSDLEGRLVWSALGTQDFTVTEASAADLPGVIDDLITNIPNAELIFVLAQKAEGVTAMIVSTKNQDLAELFPGSHPNEYGGSGVTWDIAKSDLSQAEQEVLTVARRALAGKK